MPIVMNMEWDGVTTAQYEKIRQVVDFETQVPKGALLHIAALTPAGLRVTDVWDSAENFNRFVETRLMPGVKEAGIQGQPKVQIEPVHNLYTPAFKRL
ncbi:MAG TPA: hypothetical protein VH374_11475 [Polyangia bacterium]|jgi:hypothetical protein|nr:hypothetical protein [Polyangia bacterium]